jgi:dolichol-phosphate mannosyltransferase
VSHSLYRDSFQVTTYLKYNVVGVSGYAIQSATLFLLAGGGGHSHYLLSTAVAVELAVINNFFWHQRWTWIDRPSRSLVEITGRFVKFHIANGAISLVGNVLLMGLFVGRFMLPLIAANALSVLACSLVNFVLADRLVFSNYTPRDIAV